MIGDIYIIIAYLCISIVLIVWYILTGYYNTYVLTSWICFIIIFAGILTIDKIHFPQLAVSGCSTIILSGCVMSFMYL